MLALRVPSYRAIPRTDRASTLSCRAVPYAIFLVAVNTLVRLVSNVLAHPGVAKYSRVRFNNDALQKKLFSKVGGLAALK